jgi:hypothetical protein
MQVTFEVPDDMTSDALESLREICEGGEWIAFRRPPELSFEEVVAFTSDGSQILQVMAAIHHPAEDTAETPVG